MLTEKFQKYSIYTGKKKIKIKEAARGQCMRENDGNLCFSDNESGKVWETFVEIIMNEEKIRIIMWKKKQ